MTNACVMDLRRGVAIAASVLILAACGPAQSTPEETTTTTATSSSSLSATPATSTEPSVEPRAPVVDSAPPVSAVTPVAERHITGCQMGLGPVETYWSDGTVTGYSAHCQAIADETLREEREANTPVCDGTVCRYPSGVTFPDPNAAPTVEVRYTCNYDVLCDEAGNVIPGPGGPENGVLLGNGQTCAGNGCTRPR